MAGIQQLLRESNCVSIMARRDDSTDVVVPRASSPPPEDLPDLLPIFYEAEPDGGVSWNFGNTEANMSFWEKKNQSIEFLFFSTVCPGITDR